MTATPEALSDRCDECGSPIYGDDYEMTVGYTFCSVECLEAYFHEGEGDDDE